MQITLEGQPYELIPLRVFRESHNLPESFSVIAFQPKDYTGLAKMSGAGPVLQVLRSTVLAAARTQAARLGEVLHPYSQQARALEVAGALTAVFERELRRINSEVGLREPEIGFAAAGFDDALRADVYALLRARAAGAAPLSITAIYHEWLMHSVRPASAVLPFAWHGEDWQVQVLSHVYGRFGLLVRRPGGTDAIYDPQLACPAEGFTMTLLAETCAILRGE